MAGSAESRACSAARNASRDVGIIRSHCGYLPFGEDQNERPVASVSDRYDLLQHRVVGSWLASNVQARGLDNAKAKVVMTEYGERIRISIPLAERNCNLLGDSLSPAADDDDIYQPEIEVANSVDRSSALHVSVRWRRLVCLNGMFTAEEDRMRSAQGKPSPGAVLLG